MTISIKKIFLVASIFYFIITYVRNTTASIFNPRAIVNKIALSLILRTISIFPVKSPGHSSIMRSWTPDVFVAYFTLPALSSFKFIIIYHVILPFRINNCNFIMLSCINPLLTLSNEACL